MYIVVNDFVERLSMFGVRCSVFVILFGQCVRDGIKSFALSTTKSRRFCLISFIWRRLFAQTCTYTPSRLCKQASSERIKSNKKETRRKTQSFVHMRSRTFRVVIDNIIHHVPAQIRSCITVAATAMLSTSLFGSLHGNCLCIIEAKNQTNINFVWG